MYARLPVAPFVGARLDSQTPEKSKKCTGDSSIYRKYEDNELTTTQLLRACSHITGLGPDTTHDHIHDEYF
ncbi:hypothetical protein DPMN_015029 [Dreissena polymorpha]|uniref:Uncharacterized protein n=1 Tax=Dreissena polymorpha TaxID=45954 RepID=A0A9D4S549_DREPO|nr:hypothetical protein DPMN_015029 [Dreissena polymorpha]